MESFLGRLDEAMAEFKTETAFVDRSGRRTFAAVAKDLRETEKWLKARGCQTGDRIAALTYNSTDAVLLEWATYRLGGTWIGIPTLERDLGNLERVFADFQPRLVLVEPEALGTFSVETLASLAEPPLHEIELPQHFDGDRFRMLERAEGELLTARFQVGHEPVVRIRYTSGATGEPKAIAYTEQTMTAILDNILRILRPSQKETVVHGLPSVWASGSLIAPAFCRGAKNLLLPRWDLLEFVEAVTQEPRPFTFLVPSLVADLVRYSELSGAGWARNLRRALVAGGPAPISTMRRARRVLPKVRFLITFGQTEASFPVTLHRVEAKDVNLNGRTNRRPFVPLGRLTPPYRRSKVDSTTGELRLLGNAVAAGRWCPREGRFSTLERPHATGDLVREDSAGVLHYLGRRDPRAIDRRRWPAPEAVEALIREHPGVKRARVDSFHPTPEGVRVDLTIEPYATVIGRAALLDLFERLRKEANLSQVSLGRLRFGEVPLTMSGKVKRPAKPGKPRRDG